MKFSIRKIILWLKNGGKRELSFEPNKVNVITGRSNTGKTAILDIIDYCFFASKSKISESIINENVSWYGLLININDKTYTIARKSLFERRVSDEYYFSSTGEIPNIVVPNNMEGSIKSVLETEFSIDKSVTFPFGSNNLKVGSKISLRYFLMFNTISGNIITNDQGIFFDKQHETRYREALPRIFDIAIGIETVENILKKEKKQELEKELLKLERKQKSISTKSENFSVELKGIIKQAREFSLIDSIGDDKKALSDLKNVIAGFVLNSSDNSKRDSLEKRRNTINRKIKNLQHFVYEYEIFKKHLIAVEDSLKPIEFLKTNSSDLVKTSFFAKLIEYLSTDLQEIRNLRKKKTPLNKQVNDEIAKLRKELGVIRNELLSLPYSNKSFDNDKEKYFFLGETKSKLELYSTEKNSPIENIKEGIKDLKEKINTINIINTEEKRNLTIKLIEEIIVEYISIVSEALENYSKFLPIFDYKNKSLLLRKPKTSFIENVGSSSNHMFLHLFFLLAIHETAFLNKSPFVAPFLIIDQPSRPYYGEDNSKEDLNLSDESKISEAFILLDEFIENRIKNGGEFQMIVFEHIPPRIFKDMGNIHLVEEFRSDNALIPYN